MLNYITGYQKNEEAGGYHTGAPVHFLHSYNAYKPADKHRKLLTLTCGHGAASRVSKSNIIATA